MKIFFLLNALIWCSYSLICTVAPELLAGGVVDGLVVFDQEHWVEQVEVRAMYGGAQFAIGLFALVALLNIDKHADTALIFFIFLFAGLSFVRMAGLLIDGEGLAISPSINVTPETYNTGALWFFEFPMFVYAMVLKFKPADTKSET